MEKALGDGLYLEKGECICQVKTNGKGLYLGPTSGGGFESVGDDLDLKEGGKLYDGMGLILGPNGPLKTSLFSVGYCNKQTVVIRNDAHLQIW